MRWDRDKDLIVSEHASLVMLKRDVVQNEANVQGNHNVVAIVHRPALHTWDVFQRKDQGFPVCFRTVGVDFDRCCTTKNE
jgi:hypothetical protein